MKDMGYVQFVSRNCPKDKNTIEVVALTIMSQFGANFKIMLFVVYQDHWLRSIFKNEISFPANEASLVRLEAQTKCYLKHEHANCSCVAERLRAFRNEHISASLNPGQTIFLTHLN